MPRRRKDILRLFAQTTAERSPILDLSNCNLGTLIDDVCRMDWLTELNLSHCHLGVLPDAIGGLARLRRLDLSENPLATLPDAITRLTHLKQINLKSYVTDFNVSDAVMAWLKTVPDAIWTDGNPPAHEPPRPYFLPPGHPNQLLDRLKAALKLYGDALNMEDRSFSGEGARKEADAMIAETFAETAGLQETLPEFYRDFKAHRFYSTSRESEKRLDENPFRLPTRADEQWQATTSEPLRLSAEVITYRGRVVSVALPDGKKVEVAAYAYGGVRQMNTPYEADEYFWQDCAAWLYQAGAERFYLRVETYGYDPSPSTEWLVSDDGGASWAKPPALTHEWLEKTRGTWRAVDHLPPVKVAEASWTGSLKSYRP